MHTRVSALILAVMIQSTASGAYFRGTMSVKLGIPNNIANQLEVTAGGAADIPDPIAIQTGFGVVLQAVKATSAITNPPAGGTIDVTAGPVEGIAVAPGTAYAASLFTSESFVIANKSNMPVNFSLPFMYSVDIHVEKSFLGPGVMESANLRANFGILDLINGGGIVGEESDFVIEPRLEPDDPPGVITVFCNNCIGAFAGTLAPMNDPDGLDRMELALVGGVQGNAIFLVPEPSAFALLASIVAIVVTRRLRFA